jgi:hypothetical protein
VLSGETSELEIIKRANEHHEVIEASSLWELESCVLFDQGEAQPLELMNANPTI